MASFYASPSYMNGGRFTIYSGSRRQKGGGFLGSLRSVIAPVGANVLKGIKTLARNKTVQDIAKTAARRGAEVLTNVAVDALQGQNIGESLKQRSRQAALDTLTGNKRASYTSIEPPRKKRKTQVKKKTTKTNSTVIRKQGFNKLKLNKIKQKKRRLGTLSRAQLNRRDLF